MPGESTIMSDLENALVIERRASLAIRQELAECQRNLTETQERCAALVNVLRESVRVDDVERATVTAMNRLNDDEKRVILLVARRLIIGRAAYGGLQIGVDKRDMRAESSEELLDACVYLAIASLKKEP